jgi:NodT family efflux transporter outer membrane factor (OMF) lipoprotein
VRRILLIGTAAFAIAGCDLGPDYRRPETPEPKAWDAEPAGAAWPSAEWWHGFGSPELDRLILQAEDASPDLKAAVARIEQADAQARIAGAPLLPSVELGGGVQSEQAVLDGQRANFTDYTVAPTISYEIDFWGKNRAKLQAAQETALARRYDREVVALTLVTSVANSYFQILALRDRVKVAARNLSNAQSVLKGISERRRLGGATDLDVVQQQTTVAQVQQTIPPLQQQLKENLDALAILLGKIPEGFAVAQDSILPIRIPTVAPGLPSELLARRPDIREAEAQLVSANANIKVARAQFYPSFDLTASGGFESDRLTALITPGNGIYTLAANFTQPIFEGGALEGQLDLSKGSYEELVQNYAKSILQAFGDVENALNDSAKTAEELADQQRTVDLARRAFQISQTQYYAGSATLLTVLTTQNALFPAEDMLVQGRLAHISAIVALFKALGGGWQDAQAAVRRDDLP